MFYYNGGWYDDNGNEIPDPNNNTFPDGYSTGNPGTPGPESAAPVPREATKTGSGAAPVPPGATNTGGGDDGSGGGGLLDLFQGAAPTFTPGTIGPAPVFTPPGYTPPAAFKDPTAAEAAEEPGYAFALKQGLSGVEASAAARGVLNSGGTLKDIFDYGTNAATQNYQNVDNRARGNYLLNYQTQYTDPYAFAYRSAADAFAPKMAQYAAENGAALSNASGRNTFDFNTWLQQYNIFRNRQLDTINANSATNG